MLNIPLHFLNAKWNDLIGFKDILKLFYETEKINPNNEDQKRLRINTASKLHDKLLNIYTTQYDNLSEDQKKNNEGQEKDLEKRKVMIIMVSTLYDKPLKIYTIQYDNISEDQKKNINVLNVLKLNSWFSWRLFITNATNRRWWRSKIRPRRNYFWKSKIKSLKKKKYRNRIKNLDSKQIVN